MSLKPLPFASPRAQSRPSRARLLVLAAAVITFSAACGSGETAGTTAGDDETVTTVSDDADDGADEAVGDDADGADDGNSDDEIPPVDEEGPTPDPVVEDDAGYEPTIAMDDLTAPQAHPIDEVVVSDDGLTLGVRYQASTEPCSGARAVVAEDDTTVTVTLESGLHPDAASMSCIQQIVAYELAVALEAPLGDRDLAFDGADAGSGDDGDDTTSDNGGNDDAANDGGDDGDDDQGDGMSDDGLSAPEAFVGLSIDEATALADREGRAWRIARQDDEQFALTEDYSPDRVNFEVDGGTVTVATAG